MRLWAFERREKETFTEYHLSLLGKVKFVKRRYTRAGAKLNYWIWRKSKADQEADPAIRWHCVFNAIPDMHINCWKVYAKLFGYTFQGDFYARRRRKCPLVSKKS